MSRLRVAFVSFHTSPGDPPGVADAGGMNVYVDRLARALGDLDVAVDVFTRSAARAATDEVAAGVRIVALPGGPPGPLAKEELTPHAPAFATAIAAYARAMRARYDIVHSHYWQSGVAGIALARRWDVPLVHTHHTIGAFKNETRPAGAPLEPELRLRAERAVIGAAALVTASTDEERLWIGGSSARTLTPGVDHRLFRPGDRTAARSWLDLDDRPLFLAAGRIQALKGLELAVRALPLVDDLSTRRRPSASRRSEHAPSPRIAHCRPRQRAARREPRRESCKSRRTRRRRARAGRQSDPRRAPRGGSRGRGRSRACRSLAQARRCETTAEPNRGRARRPQPSRQWHARRRQPARQQTSRGSARTARPRLHRLPTHQLQSLAQQDGHTSITLAPAARDSLTAPTPRERHAIRATWASASSGGRRPTRQSPNVQWQPRGLVSGVLRSGGRVVGSFVMQDDAGVTKLESRFVGDPIGIYFKGRLVAELGASRATAGPDRCQPIVPGVPVSSLISLLHQTRRHA
jgi:hypothetical protein